MTASRALLLAQWAWREGTVTRLWKAVHTAPVAAMAFDPTSTLLATGRAASGPGASGHGAGAVGARAPSPQTRSHRWLRRRSACLGHRAALRDTPLPGLPRGRAVSGRRGGQAGRGPRLRVAPLTCPHPHPCLQLGGLPPGPCPPAPLLLGCGCRRPRVVPAGPVVPGRAGCPLQRRHLAGLQHGRPQHAQVGGRTGRPGRWERAGSRD